MEVEIKSSRTAAPSTVATRRLTLARAALSIPTRHPISTSSSGVHAHHRAKRLKPERVSESSQELILVGFDKGMLPLPRVMHILALPYVLSQFGAFRAIAGSAKLAAVSLLGKQGLAVFAWGSLVCISLQVLRDAYVFSPVVDRATLVWGLALQYGVALRLQTEKMTLQPRSQIAHGSNLSAAATT